DTTKAALAEANDTAASAQARVQREQDQQDEVLQQLAYLKGTSVATEAAYWTAQQAKRAEAQLASNTGGSGATAATGTGTGSGSGGGAASSTPSTGGGTSTQPSAGGGTTGGTKPSTPTT
ncbi:hypothetical protein, partial [Curtobacterium sp. MCBA15_013]|uniref:hypothetical protein n=1 Tax=Curtobacterium sp. MCBA15_013 TaxID=1898739 RepID=UPI001586FFD4